MRRIRREINVFDIQAIIFTILAEGEWVVARNAEGFVENVLVAAEEGRGLGCCKRGEEQGQDSSGEKHHE